MKRRPPLPRFFTFLLRLLPFDFQRDYGGDMQDVFRAEHQAARQQGKPLATTKLWWRTTLGMLSIAPREHFDALRSDVSFALRSFVKRPGFSAISILTLALAIGANTAIFSVVNGVMLRPFPYPAIDRILMLNEINERDGMNFSVWYLNFKDWAAQSTVFEHLGIYRQGSANLTGHGHAERINAATVSSAVFPTMGVAPLAGRTFSAGDDRAGAAPSVIISERLWQSRFGASSSIVGDTIVLNGIRHTVVGVMPAAMRFPSRLTDAWLPFGLIEAQLPAARGAHPNLWVVGRLKADVTVDRAEAELSAIADRLSVAYPESNATNGIRVVPFYEGIVQNIRPMLALLVGAVGLVLVIACVNLTNLTLARAESRRHEMAVRASLGAGRGRLIRQLLTESLVLSVAGAALGLVLANWAVAALVRMAPSSVPRLDQIRVDGTVLAFAATVSIASALLSGLAPAIRASRSDLQTALREGTKGAGGRERARFRASLVVAEVALALVVLLGAGLNRPRIPEAHEDRRWVRPDQRDLGPRGSSRVAIRRRRAVDQLSCRARAPARLDSGGSRGCADQLASSWRQRGRIGNSAGRSFLPGPGESMTGSTFYAVSPGYFAVMGMRLSTGRTFTDRDNASAPLVAVVDDRLAQVFWPHESALGKRVAFEFEGGGDEGPPRPIWREVVGIVGTVKHYGLTVESPRVQIYTPVTQLPLWFRRRHPSMAFALKTAVPTELVLGQVRREVAAIDRDLPVHSIVAAEDLVGDQTASSRMSMWLMMLFGLLALSLSVVGVYGMMAYAVSRRTQEFGLRLALGATRGAVLGLVMRQALLLLVPGLILGVAGGAALGRLAQDMFYGVSPGDPVTFVAVSAILVAVGLLASCIPAQRAIRVDPLAALRSE